MADIIYTLEGGVYMNITNKCPCRCTFCIRSLGDAVGDAHNLWFHGKEPSFDEIKAAIDAYDFDNVDGVVFCGYGEPTESLDVLLKTAEYLRKVKPGIKSGGCGQSPQKTIDTCTTISIPNSNYITVTRPRSWIWHFHFNN